MTSDAATPVIEVVTFHLAKGQSVHSLLVAARATGPMIARQPGFMARHLSLGPGGRWTDHIHRASLAAARKASQAFMTDPVALPFLQALDPDSIVMRHETLHWQMP